MTKISVHLEDVGGSFARFLREAPKVARAEVGQAVKVTSFALAQRMKANAPGPSEMPPHIKDAIASSARGLTGRAGILDDGGESGSPGASQADVALFNEYSPNKQPFMLPAAEATKNEFRVAVTRALSKVEQQLSGAGRHL
jgi:hypothetical protein